MRYPCGRQRIPKTEIVLTDVRPRRGRPPTRTDAETLRLLGRAASAEFVRHGYADTSVAAVAKAAGVSTRTMYRLVPTKAELFALSMEDRLDRFMGEIDAEHVAGLPLPEALEQILFAHATLVLSPEAVGISRLLYAESERFPELARRYHERAVMRVDGAIAAWLEAQRRDGKLSLPVDGVSGFLRGMMVGDVQRPVLLRLSEPPDPDALRARAKACATLFLRGCLP